MYYVVDKDNKILMIRSKPEQLEQYHFDDTDTILYGIAPKTLFKTDTKPDKITLDFTKNELIIEGCSVTLNKCEYEGNGTYTLEKEELEEWDKLLTDCKKCAKEFVMIGTPPIKGELLNVE